MPMDKWDACAFSVDPESLRGRICYGGLDPSSSTDITAFVLVFSPLDENDKYTMADMITFLKKQSTALTKYDEQLVRRLIKKVKLTIK
jgi:phage terminase large subunit-like protein